MTDARFEDGDEGALALKAETAEDLAILSALLQDAVLQTGDARWDRRGRTLTFLVNRFRWEDQAAAEAQHRRYERVRALFVVSSVLSVASQGFDHRDGDLILSILSVDWEEAEAPGGRLVITLAGDGAIAVQAECIDLTLVDVSRPYYAAAGQAPHHPD